VVLCKYDEEDSQASFYLIFERVFILYPDVKVLGLTIISKFGSDMHHLPSQEGIID